MPKKKEQIIVWTRHWTTCSARIRRHLRDRDFYIDTIELYRTQKALREDYEINQAQKLRITIEEL